MVPRWADSDRRPMVVMSGEHDSAPSPQTARALTNRPDRRFVLVENSGHDVNLERPDVFDPLLADAITWIRTSATQPADKQNVK